MVHGVPHPQPAAGACPLPTVKATPHRRRHVTHFTEEVLHESPCLTKGSLHKNI